MSRQPHTPRLLGLAGAAVLTTGLLVSAPGGAVADAKLEEASQAVARLVRS